MKIFTVIRYLFSLCGCAALLVSCAALRQAQDDTQQPGAMPPTSAFASRTNSSNYSVLYSFGAAPDGNNPVASLIDVGGTLYGTTTRGGSNTCEEGYTYRDYFTCGTVFSITTAGTEKVLYSFGPTPDGNTPVASLLDVGGTLYGTTNQGGAYTCGYQSDDYGCGTVFSVTKSGTEKVLFSFRAGNASVGVAPEASLIEVGGELYGTTVGGGSHSCGIYVGGCGTVFRITTDGTEHVVHSFRRGRRGSQPHGSLIDVGGLLYGTTLQGGPYSCRSAYGCGAVFSMTLGGREKVLHIFGNGADGKRPAGGLIDVKGTFYGTTSQGGAHGYGAVFSITPGGSEIVLYSFGYSPDGQYPGTDLIELNGALYGTTSQGGAHGDGTVFSVTTKGTETVLHSFGGGSDGTNPSRGLISVDGTLYGTTYAGGANGNGTVFALTP